MKACPSILRNLLLGTLLLLGAFLAIAVVSSSGLARDQSLLVEFSRPPAYDLTVDPGDPGQIVDGQRVEGVMWLSRRAVGWNSDGRPITITLGYPAARQAGKICLHLGQRAAAEAFLPRSIDVFGSNGDKSPLRWLGAHYPSANVPGDPNAYSASEACINFDPRPLRTIEIVVAPRGPYVFTDEITVAPGRIARSAVEPAPLDAIATPAAFAMRRLWLHNALEGVVRDHPGKSGNAARQLQQLFATGKIGQDTAGLDEAVRRFGLWRASTMPNENGFRLVKANPFAAASPLDLPIGVPGSALYLSPGKVAIAAASITPVGPNNGKFAFDFSVEGAPSDWFRAELSHLDTVLAASGTAAADVLRPLTSPLAVPTGLQRMVWINIRANGDAKEGRYRARLVVRDLDTGISKTVTWPIHLYRLKPAAAPFASVAWGYPDQSPMRLRPDLAAQDMLDHGVNVAVIPASLMPWPTMEDGRLQSPDFRPFDRALDTFAGSRRILLFLGFKGRDMARSQRFGLPDAAPGPEWDRRFSAWIASLATHLRARGVDPERVAFYPVDEPGSPQERLMFSRLASLIQRGAPGFPIYTTLRITKDVDPAAFRQADIVQLDDATFDPLFAGALLAAKKQVWLYGAEASAKGADPARVYRGLAWRAVAAGLQGSGVWSYSLNGDNGSPWDDFDGTEQDRAMVYPTDKGWLPSRRWEAWRLGMQDAELLLAALDRADTPARKRRVLHLAAAGARAQNDPATLGVIVAELVALAGAD